MKSSRARERRDRGPQQTRCWFAGVGDRACAKDLERTFAAHAVDGNEYFPQRCYFFRR